jgi:ribonuclease P protein component
LEKKFPPQARLRKTREFENVYRNGRRATGSSIVMVYLENNTEKSRLGAVISKKVGKAVIRNRFKRYIREIFRLHRDELSKGFDIIVIARKSAREASFRILEGEMLICFKKIIETTGQI